MREIYQSMEQGLTLIGATGIEDRLQDKVCAIFSIFKDNTKRAEVEESILTRIFISRWGNFHFIFQVVETVRDLKQAGIKVVKLCYKKHNNHHHHHHQEISMIIELMNKENNQSFPSTSRSSIIFLALSTIKILLYMDHQPSTIINHQPLSTSAQHGP